MSDRTLVEVPENALRDEPLAFGLTAAQLGLLGVAAAVALVLNAVPLPAVAAVVLTVVTAAPIAIAALLPVRGEPAYRWLCRAAGYGRGRRLWQAALVAADKSEISGRGDDPGSTEVTEEVDALPETRVREPETSGTGTAEASDAGDRGGAPLASAQRSDPPARRALGRPSDRAARLRVVDREETSFDEPKRDDPWPHLVTGLRLACVLSFAGGVGKTTLAVETATLIASRGRYRTLEGVERRLEVLLLDASRLNAAAGFRLGLAPEALSQLQRYHDWRDPRSVERAALSTRSGLDVVALPPALPLDAAEGFRFGAVEAEAILDGAQRVGYQLVVADLGSVHEDGHRALIDQSAVVLGVVRPTLESLPDVLRLANYLRGLGMGRKLALVANAAHEDGDVRRLAGEAGVPFLGLVPASPVFTAAAERGEPAWAVEDSLVAAVLPVATTFWPLLPGTAPRGSDRIGDIVAGIGRAFGLGGHGR